MFVVFAKSLFNSVFIRLIPKISTVYKFQKVSTDMKVNFWVAGPMKTLKNHFEIKIQEFLHFQDIKNQSFLNSRVKVKTLMVTLFFPRLKNPSQSFQRVIQSSTATKKEEAVFEISAISAKLSVFSIKNLFLAQKSFLSGDSVYFDDLLLVRRVFIFIKLS